MRVFLITLISFRSFTSTGKLMSIPRRILISINPKTVSPRWYYNHLSTESIADYLAVLSSPVISDSVAFTVYPRFRKSAVLVRSTPWILSEYANRNRLLSTVVTGVVPVLTRVTDPSSLRRSSIVSRTFRERFVHVLHGCTARTQRKGRNVIKFSMFNYIGVSTGYERYR